MPADRFSKEAKEAQKQFMRNLNPFDKELLERAYPDDAPSQIMVPGCLGCLWLVAFPVLIPAILIRWAWNRSRRKGG